MTQPTDEIYIPYISSKDGSFNKSSDKMSERSYNDSPVRKRVSSKDIPRTYSGLYGTGGENGDLLSYELTRNVNTEWVSAGGSFLRITYCFFVFLMHILTTVFLPYNLTWTGTNLIHGFVSIIFLHWIKGSPDCYDQGELNALTLWEQLSSNPDTDLAYGFSKEILLIIPAVLSYAGCHFSDYDTTICVINLLVWSICTLAKTRFMHGVRILGINRTAGIDDYNRKLL